MLELIIYGVIGATILTVAGVWGWIETQPQENDYGERHRTS